MKHNRAPYYLYDHLARKFHEIGDGSVCGRMEGEIRFPGDDLMSRAHCRFVVSGSDLYIEDLKSTNRTRVNTVPIRPKVKRRIQLNDMIEIGVQRFTLTNQRKFAPGNEQDHGGTRRVYKGRQLEDGGLSAQVSKVFTKQTLIVLDKYRFHALRLKGMVSAKSGSRPRKERATGASAMLVGALIFAVSVGTLVFGRGAAQAHCQAGFDVGFCVKLAAWGYVKSQPLRELSQENPSLLKK